VKSIRITAIRPTTVTVPLEAPLRHANGCHWGRFVRTVVEVDTDAGITGLGEMGGGGESAEAQIKALEKYLVGTSPFDLERQRFMIANPTASLYNNRTQMLAAIEFACIDIMGKALGVPAYQLFGGKLRDAVPFASYLFYRYPDREGRHETRTVEQLVAHALELKRTHGFTSHKLKSGVFPWAYELQCYRALAEALPGDSFRYDPNCAMPLEDAIRFGRAIADIDNDYFEDPTWGMNGNRQVRAATGLRIATNTLVVGFEQLAANIRDHAIDVILLDTTFWGGMRNCIKAAAVCETMQLGIAVHSSGELGIQLATMLHLGAVLPNLTYSADAHYHHLADDVIEGGKMAYEGGAIRVPDGPGLGVTLDRDKLAQYAGLYKRLGGYPYDMDPGRPGWAPMVPNTSWADPADARVPVLS
jgi:glucarate dehydratase